MAVVEWLIMVSLPFAFTECFYIYIHIRCEEGRQNRPRKTLNSKTQLDINSKTDATVPIMKMSVSKRYGWGGGGGGGKAVVLARLLLKIPALG